VLVLTAGVGLALGDARPEARAVDLTPARKAEVAKQSAELTTRAAELYRQGKYAEALGPAEQALALRQRLYPAARYPDGHPDLAQSLSWLGGLLEAQGEYTRALPYAQRALAMRERLYPAARYPDGHPDLARSLNNLGALLEARGEYARAQPYHEHALAMWEKLYPAARYPDGHPDLANSLSWLGGLLEAQGEYARALPYAQRALAMYEQLYPAMRYPDGHPDLARSLNNLGALLEAQGEYARALPYYERALAMRERLYPAARYPDGHADLAQSLNNLGFLLLARGESARAQPYYERALAMYQQVYPAARYPDGHPDLATSLNNVGLWLMARGESARALPHLERALAMRERLYPAARYSDGHPHLARSLNNLGALLEAQGEYARALPYYERALAMYERLYPPASYADGHPDLATSLNNLGGLLETRGEYARALPYAERALAMWEKLYPAARYPDGHPHLAQSLNNLGALLEARGEYARALPYYERALAMWEKLYPAARYPDGHPHLAQSLNNLGFLLLARAESARALPHFERALEQYQRQAERLAMAAAEAEALAFARSLPLTRDGYLSVTRQLPGSAAAYARLWPGRNAVTRVLQRRHLALRAARGRPEVRARWDELGDVRRQLARLLLAAPRPAQADEDLRALTARKERLERALAEQVPLLAAQQALDRLGPADLQTRLRAGAAFVDLIRYMRFEQDPQQPGKQGERRTPSYVAFVLSPGRAVRRVELGAAVPIEQALDRWRQAIADRRDSPAAAELRRRLWEPLASHLPADVEAVYLAADGALARLPWAALPGRRPDTVVLEEHTVAVVPFGQFLLGQLAAPAKPTDAPAPPAAIVAVGGVAYDDAPAAQPAAVAALQDSRPPERSGRRGAWTPLPGTEKEVAKLQALAGGTLRLLAGRDAGTARLATELPQARLAHLATHGFFDEQLLQDERRLEQAQLQGWHFDPARPTLPLGEGARNPLAFCGLVLAGANRPSAADPGILTGEALLGLRLEGLELAVLSACQTGLGDAADRECSRHLQLAFHLAGCRNVVASLWDVPDEATAALMAVFYDELLRQKKPPLEALRQAQLTVYRHPGQLRELAERGPVRVKQAPPGAATDSARAATKDWAGFVLSGLGG
jgi:tetratricopeptide (TPR) repeat protein